MSKSPNSQFLEEQVSLFADLELAGSTPFVPPQPSVPMLEGEEDGVERGENGAPLLRRVLVNPVALSRAATVMSVFAREYGVTYEERSQLKLILKEDHLLLLADLDQGFSRSADGKPRPMRMRYSVPLTLTDRDEGGAREVGALIRSVDPVVALRNSVINSENFGILSEDRDVILEVYEDTERGAPGYFALHAPEHGVNEPRYFQALAGVPVEGQVETEMKQATRGLSNLDSDALMEVASYSSAENGVCLMMGLGEKESGYAVGLGRQGVMLSQFGLPKEAALSEGEEARELSGDIVLPRRFAWTLGVTQNAFEGAMKSKQKGVTNEHAAHVLAAALAAALDAAGDDSGAMLTRLREEVASGSTRKAWLSARAQHGDAVRAVAFARTLLEEMPAEDRAEFAQQAQALAGAWSREASAQGIQAVRHLADSEAVASVASSYLASGGEEALLDPALNRLIGAARLRRATHDVLRDVRNDEDARTAANADAAAAAVRLRGDKSGSLTTALLPMVPEEKGAEWWESFAGYMEKLDVPAEAREKILEKRSGNRIPKTGEMVIPANLREKWIGEAKATVQGQLWADEDGRVHAGFGDPTIGYFMMSDRAEQPVPERYPVRRADVEAFVAKRPALEWKTQVWSSDLEFVADRVSALADPHQEDPAMTTLFVARWTPAGHPEGPTGKVLQHFSRLEDKVPATPETVQVGEGASADEFVLERNNSEAVEDQTISGTLRVFGIHAGGERLHLTLPMKARPSGATAQPFAVAMDADRVNFLAGYVARKGRYCVLEAGGGMVRISDQHLSRVSVLPALTSTRVPPRLRPIVAAAGVPAEQTRSVGMEEVFARAAEMRAAYARAMEALPPRGVEQEPAEGASIIRKERKKNKKPSSGYYLYKDKFFIRSDWTTEQTVSYIKAELLKIDQYLAALSQPGGVTVQTTRGLLGPQQITVGSRKKPLSEKSIRNRRAERRNWRAALQEKLAAISHIEVEETLVAGQAREGLGGVRLLPDASQIQDQDAESSDLFEASEVPVGQRSQRR